MSPSTIPVDEIRSGDPGQDGIPAVVNPRVLAAVIGAGAGLWRSGS